MTCRLSHCLLESLLLGLLRDCVRLRALGLLRARGSGRPSEGRLLRGHSEDGNQETSKPQRASHRHV